MTKEFEKLFKYYSIVLTLCLIIIYLMNNIAKGAMHSVYPLLLFYLLCCLSIITFVYFIFDLVQRKWKNCLIHITIICIVTISYYS